MENQISDRMDWFEVETIDGTEFIEFYLAPKAPIEKGETIDIDNPLFDEVCGHIALFIDEKYKICEITRINGFGARLSMPGYMDRTHWTVHQSREEAEEYLELTYGME